MLEYYKANDFICRTPLLPFSTIDNLFGNFSIDKLISLYQNPIFQDALYIASPVLYQELQKATLNEELSKDKRLIKSLIKYISRASSRCTPYGLFAGLTPGAISTNPTTIEILKNPLQRLRLDMAYLFNVYNCVTADKDLRKNLIYFPNSSLYKVNNNWRFTECRTNNEKQTHHLVNVEDNKVLSRLISISHKGISYLNCIEIIKSFGYDLNTSENYLNELISSQILISEIYPNTTGIEYQKVLFKKLSTFTKYKKELENVSNVLNQSLKLESKVDQLENILSNVFPAKIKKDNFIQVDVLRNANKSLLNETIVNNIKDASSFLIQISRFSEPIALSNYKKLFYERYEEMEVPLLELMDKDIGINYHTPQEDGNINKTVTFLWDEISKFKFELYIKSQNHSLFEVIINEVDIKGIGVNKEVSVPNDLVFMGKLLREENESRIFYGHMGSNASALLGRFGYLDDKIRNICIGISNSEELEQPDKIFAEIVHIPEPRIGNIISHPHYRKYEIPYMSQSRLPTEYQILLSDLQISLKNNKFYIRSKKLNKEVIPRMANAHNFSSMGIPIYHFLADVQNQEQMFYLAWNWDFLEDRDFLPRIVYRNVILSPATWNIKTETIKKIKELDKNKRLSEFHKFRMGIRMPDYILFKESDNELLLNLNSDVCIDIIFDLANKTSNLRFIEFIFDYNNLLVRDESNNGYTNEIIIPFINLNKKIQYHSKSNVHRKKNSLKTIRIFEPYSHWVYYKIYTGHKASDRIISDPTFKITSKLKRDNIIDKWHFLRYKDPHDHIRIRFHLTESKNFNELNKVISKYYGKYVKNNIVWKIQIDTYKRELERYGSNIINLTEDVYFHDSECVMELLCLFKSDKNQKERLLIGLLGMDKLFEAFGFSLQEKFIKVEECVELFSFEFNVKNSKFLREKIIRDYRNEKLKIETILSVDGINQSNYEIFKRAEIIFNKHYRNLKAISNELENKKSEKNIDELIKSYIHMFLNRFFNSEQRYFEMILYNYLQKYYKSKLMKERYN